VVVINQLFGGATLRKDNPIGQKIQLHQEREFLEGMADKWFEVIGVVADARNRGLEEPIEPEVWVPYTVTGISDAGHPGTHHEQSDGMVKAPRQGDLGDRS